MSTNSKHKNKTFKTVTFDSLVEKREKHLDKKWTNANAQQHTHTSLQFDIDIEFLVQIFAFNSLLKCCTFLLNKKDLAFTLCQYLIAIAQQECLLLVTKHFKLKENKH